MVVAVIRGPRGGERRRELGFWGRAPRRLVSDRADRFQQGDELEAACLCFVFCKVMREKERDREREKR